MPTADCPSKGLPHFTGLCKPDPMGAITTPYFMFPVANGTCTICWWISVTSEEFRKGHSCCRTWRRTGTSSGNRGADLTIISLIKSGNILNTYHGLKFILIGDSGQRDAEIYSEIVKEFPGRIAAIYIRDVSKRKKGTRVKKIGEGLEASGVEMLLVKDTEEAASHAISKGFIAPDSFENIHNEREMDRNSPTELEQVLTGEMTR